jgi:hypothetical protein
MQNNTRRWQVIFFSVAVLIAAAMYFLFTISRNAVTAQVVAPPAPFGASNFNLMKTDTFLALVHNAYGDLVSYKIEEGKLNMEMKANELTKDFFNGNDALLKFGLRDFGFDIKYNPEEKSMKATFKVTEQNGVHVPNDVLIKLMDKTTKTNNVDQQQ